MQPAHRGDAINEDRFVAIEVVEPAADSIKMRLAVTASWSVGRIRATNPARYVARARPVVDTDRRSDSLGPPGLIAVFR